MCEPYYSDNEDGHQRIRMDVGDKALVKKISVGERASFKVEGVIQEVQGHRMVTDYDAPHDYKSKKPRPKKELPAKVTIKLDKRDPDIMLINAALMAEDDGATD